MSAQFSRAIVSIFACNLTWANSYQMLWCVLPTAHTFCWGVLLSIVCESTPGKVGGTPCPGGVAWLWLCRRKKCSSEPFHSQQQVESVGNCYWKVKPARQLYIVYHNSDVGHQLHSIIIQFLPFQQDFYLTLHPHRSPQCTFIESWAKTFSSIFLPLATALALCKPGPPQTLCSVIYGFPSSPEVSPTATSGLALHRKLRTPSPPCHV